MKNLYLNNRYFFVFLLLVTSSFSCKKENDNLDIMVSEELIIKKLSDHSYIHISDLTLKNGTKVACNGFIYIHNKEAYIFDTPANDIATTDLIQWLQKDKKTIIKGVVFNHFHADCNEGMDVFKKEGIPTIASKKTAKLMALHKYPEPNLLFKEQLTLTLGNKTIINTFMGEAHTVDNIVSYFPDEELIFGGCMIKSRNATKGNLADANIKEWSATVSKIKEAYPKTKTVIPGHGEHGNTELLDYTISLFKAEK